MPESKRQQVLLMFSQPWSIGGAETHFETLVNQYISLGVKVVIVGLDQKILDRFIALPVYKLDFRTVNPCLHLFNIREIIKIIANHEINIIHCHQRTSCLYAWLLNKTIGIPFICTLHDKWRSNHTIYKNFLPKNLICISAGIKQHFIGTFGIKPERLFTINNGINVEETTVDTPGSVNCDCLKIYYVSRFSRHKSPAALLLLQLMPKLIELRPNVKLVIIGDGEDAKAIVHQAALINNMYSEAVIEYLGPRNDVRHLLEAADIVVGVGRVALEGMAAGKPVLAFAAGSDYPGIITPDNWKAASQTSWTRGERELTAANILQDLLLLTGDSQLRAQLGTFGKALITSNFSARDMAKETLKIYALLLAQL